MADSHVFIISQILCLDIGMKLVLVSKNAGHKNKSKTLNTCYKCKNDYEDNLDIQNEIFKIYDFDFGFRTQSGKNKLVDT